MSIFEEEDFSLIVDAADGKLGADQERIAIEGLRWLKLLISKNVDYGSSVWKAPILAPEMPVGSAILVRMSDKIKRIESLMSGNTPLVKEEAIEDTLRDLGSYALLYLARPRMNATDE